MHVGDCYISAEVEEWQRPNDFIEEGQIRQVFNWEDKFVRNCWEEIIV